MREKLFRAKRIDNGKPVEGFLLGDAVTGKWFIHDKDSSLNESGKVGEEGVLHFLTYEIDIETLSWPTGLTDKNGKRIWENDILMCHGNPDDLVKVVFGEFGVRNIETRTVVDKVIGWHYEVIPTDEISRCEPFCYSMPLTEEYIKRCEMEVVDNPELLQEIKK